MQNDLAEISFIENINSLTWNLTRTHSIPSWRDMNNRKAILKWILNELLISWILVDLYLLLYLRLCMNVSFQVILWYLQLRLIVVPNSFIFCTSSGLTIYSRTICLARTQTHGPKIHNIGFRTQVWHHYPDIPLYLNFYHESKCEVRFILEPLV